MIKQEKSTHNSKAVMNLLKVKYRIDGNTIKQSRRTRVRGKRAHPAARGTVKIFKGSNNNKLTQPYKLIVKKAIKEHIKEHQHSTYNDAIKYLKKKGITNEKILKMITSRNLSSAKI